MKIILSEHYKKKFKYLIDFYKDKAIDIHYNNCIKGLVIASWKSSHWFYKNNCCHLLRKTITSDNNYNYNGVENVRHGLNRNEYFWDNNLLK